MPIFRKITDANDFMNIDTKKLRTLRETCSPGEWRIREVEGDYFVTSERPEGAAYAPEILGDEDYPTKRADAELIVEMANLLHPLINAYEELKALKEKQAKSIAEQPFMQYRP